MHISAFQATLVKGLGRPLLYLQNHDARPYREAILHACTHDQIYDSCEESRAPYLFDLLQLTNEPDFYRDKILSALLTHAEDEDISQMLGIARRFAQQEDYEACRVVYAVIQRDMAENVFTDADELIHLDGIEGLQFVVERYLSAQPEEDDWRPRSWIDDLEERDGKKAAHQALKQAASVNERFAEWLKAVKRTQQAQKLERKKRLRQPRLDYPSLRALIMEKGRKAHVSGSWGRDANEEELKLAAADLITEQDSGRLRAYLRIFWNQAFPGDHHYLIELTRNTEEEVSWAAMRALTRIQHPDIRAFALNLIQEHHLYGIAVEMLSRNYQGGDYALIESLLEQNLDQDEYHILGFGVRDLAETHPSAEAEQSLLLLYENGPCSICRNGCVDQLIALDRLPEWIRAECRYDAYSHTREAVQ